MTAAVALPPLPAGAPPIPPDALPLWQEYRLHAGFGWCDTCSQVGPCGAWKRIRARLVTCGLLLPTVAVAGAHHAALAERKATVG
jgi:hypothetical protein